MHQGYKLCQVSCTVEREVQHLVCLLGLQNPLQVSACVYVYLRI